MRAQNQAKFIAAKLGEKENRSNFFNVGKGAAAVPAEILKKVSLFSVISNL